MTFKIFASAETDPDWISRSVMKSIKAPFSHVGILVGDVVHESVGHGVQAVPVEHFLSDHKFLHEFDITAHVKDPSFALGWLLGNIGKDYSETQYLGFIFPFLKKFTRDGKSELICSEYVARFCRECTTINVFNDDDCDFIDPKQVIEKLGGLYGKKESS